MQFKFSFLSPSGFSPYDGETQRVLNARYKEGEFVQPFCVTIDKSDSPNGKNYWIHFDREVCFQLNVATSYRRPIRVEKMSLPARPVILKAQRYINLIKQNVKAILGYACRAGAYNKCWMKQLLLEPESTDAVKAVASIKSNLPRLSECVTGTGESAEKFFYDAVALWFSSSDCCLVRSAFFFDYPSLASQDRQISSISQELLDEIRKADLSAVNKRKSRDQSAEVLQEPSPNKKRKRNSSKFPEWWQPSKAGTAATYELQKSNADYVRAESLFNRSMSGRADVIKVERICNEMLWKKYCSSLHFIAEKTKKPQERLTALMFHGTSSEPPSNIWKCQAGFDPRFSNDGYFGRGSYFAVDASYSCRQYQHKLHDGTGQIFLAEVTCM